MNNTRLIILIVLFLSLALFAGCGKKAPPVFTGKSTPGITGQGTGSIDLNY